MTDKPRIIVPVPNLVSDGNRLRDALKDEDAAYEARKALLDSTAPDANAPAPDSVLGANEQHRPVAQNEAFDKKVYFFPEEFNALRRELQENYKEFFETINPLTGTSPAYCMVFDAPQFIGYCNGVTGLAQQFDAGNVAGICKNFLNAFRKMRGVSPL